MNVMDSMRKQAYQCIKHKKKLLQNMTAEKLKYGSYVLEET